MDVETAIEPPLLDTFPDEDRPTIHINVCLSEGDGTHRSGSILLDATADDHQLASALIAALRGCATMRGPGLAAAVEQPTRGAPVSRHPVNIVDQPPPVRRADAVSVQALVRADLNERERIGVERYGTPLQPHNGRDALVDAYQECLDLACYLRQAIEERGGTQA